MKFSSDTGNCPDHDYPLLRWATLSWTLSRGPSQIVGLHLSVRSQDDTPRTLHAYKRNNPESLGDLPSPWVLTTYPSPGIFTSGTGGFSSVCAANHEGSPARSRAPWIPWDLCDIGPASLHNSRGRKMDGQAKSPWNSPWFFIVPLVFGGGKPVDVYGKDDWRMADWTHLPQYHWVSFVAVEPALFRNTWYTWWTYIYALCIHSSPLTPWQFPGIWWIWNRSKLKHMRRSWNASLWH